MLKGSNPEDREQPQNKRFADDTRLLRMEARFLIPLGAPCRVWPHRRRQEAVSKGQSVIRCLMIMEFWCSSLFAIHVGLAPLAVRAKKEDGVESATIAELLVQAVLLYRKASLEMEGSRDGKDQRLAAVAVAPFEDIGGNEGLLACYLRVLCIVCNRKCC